MGMNGPNDMDDGWAELARELGLEGDRSFPTPVPDHPVADLHPPEDPAPETDDEEFVEEAGEAPTEADIQADGEVYAEADGEEGDDGEEIEGEGEGEPAAPGEPGEPRKKRRRRRRRKKKDGSAPAETASGEESADDSEESAEVDDSEESALPTDGLVEEEGATPAATRELIANWDVPSWETIVNTMLFRPQGR